ncbi:MAG TPA: ATPase, T2SS/T4P/T4SS family [Candidatus Acidoferrales bacterium]|nr:ATPase, T2SS/T4P/T4SS family [Candidatus Acidoferrales bacterium]
MYTSFYELREEPFRLTPDPRFLHLADPHRAALKLLLHGVLQRKGFMLVTGPVGTGKTTLLHTALQILTEKVGGSNRLVSAFLVNPTLSPSELLEAMLDEFEISCTSTSKPRRLAAFHQMLYETQQQGGTAVLLIDEAHLMSAELLEEVRLLGNTDTYQEKLVQIVLCGQPELFSVLQRPELRALQQRIAATCQLRALSLPETRAYIAERLHAAGLKASSPFSASAVESIHKWSGGVPRLINLLCDSCLTLGFESQKKEIDEGLVDQAASDLPGLAHNNAKRSAMPSVDELMPTGPLAAPVTEPRANGANGSKAAAAQSHFFHAPKPSGVDPSAFRQQPVIIVPPPDAGWTRSTFDTLIAALKHGRDSAE